MFIQNFFEIPLIKAQISEFFQNIHEENNQSDILDQSS